MTHGLRFWYLSWTACCLLCLTVATTAWAQQPQGRRPGGFLGGPGGPGGGSGDWVQLLGSEQVQKELELVDEQKDGIRKVADEARERMREGFSGFQGLRDLSEEERNKRFAEMREKAETMAKETRKKLEEVLLPHQVERLQQISLQVRGAAALTDPEVAGKLGLSDDQKQQLQKAQEENREKMRGMFQGGGQGGSGEDAQRRFAEAREAAAASYLAVLTAEQKEQFEKLKGEKFELDMSQIQRRFGGPGGGTGGPPRRRPGNNNNNNNNN